MEVNSNIFLASPISEVLEAFKWQWEVSLNTGGFLEKEGQVTLPVQFIEQANILTHLHVNLVLLRNLDYKILTKTWLE